MHMSVIESATLPDGTVVQVSAVPEAWWKTSEAGGFINPKLLAPDPEQPRRHINAESLQELHESIANRGVREAITATPRQLAPWIKVAPEHEECFFVIVSGHRRWNGACLANLPAVPIKVRVYENEAEYHLDASLLNAHREPLTPLEEGYELARLRGEGWKLERLRTFFGGSLPGLYMRINLTRLDPSIQALLDPSLPEKKRLSTSLGGALGAVKPPTQEELEDLLVGYSDIIRGKEISLDDIECLDEEGRRLGLQRLLFCVITERKLNSARAVEFVKEQTLRHHARQGASGRKPQRYQPKRRKDILLNLVQEITGSVIIDWSPAEFRRVFDLASREEVEEIIAKIEEATDVFSGLIKILGNIRDAKRPSHPVALRIATERSRQKLAS